MQEQGEEQPQGEEQGQLINKEVWPDAKPGESRMFRCLKVMDKEIEVMAEEGDEMPQEGGEEPAMAESGGGMMD
jgi:hypothetical protein